MRFIYRRFFAEADKIQNSSETLRLAYRAAERDSFSELPDVSAAADQYLSMVELHRKGKLPLTDEGLFNAHTAYYSTREEEFRDSSGV